MIWEKAPTEGWILIRVRCAAAVAMGPGAAAGAQRNCLLQCARGAMRRAASGRGAGVEKVPHLLLLLVVILLLEELGRGNATAEDCAERRGNGLREHA